MQNHFELFNLPVQFAIDRSALDTAYQKIQHLVHPDRFVTATEAEKRMAMQWATKANDAYQILRDPLKRAIYLCELNGYDVRKETHVALDPAFLMQQMEWRDTLQQAQASGNKPILEQLQAQNHHLYQQKLHLIEKCLDSHQLETAVQEIRQLMFLEKFGMEINRSIDELDPTH